MRLPKTLITVSVTALLALLTIGAFAQGMMNGNVPGLEDNPLTNEQRQQIAQIRQDMRQQIQDVRMNQNLTQQQRQQRIQEIRLETHQEIMDVLTPAQRNEFQDWWQERQMMGMRGATPAGPGMGPGMRMGAGPGFVPGLQDNPLTAEQRQQIAQIRQNYAQQMRDVRMNQNLTQQQRSQRIQQLRQEQHEEIMDVLTPAQRNEFQNWWQERAMMGPQQRIARGAGIGMGPGQAGMDMVPGLQQNPLTDEQRQQIAQIRQETQNQIRDIRMNQNLTQQEREQQIQQIRTQQHERIMDVLTPAQQEEFRNWWQQRDTQPMGQGGGMERGRDMQ